MKSFILLLFLISHLPFINLLNLKITGLVLSFLSKYTQASSEPLGGGMNSPQFSSINLNQDSWPDFLYSIKVGDKVLPI